MKFLNKNSSLFFLINKIVAVVAALGSLWLSAAVIEGLQKTNNEYYGINYFIFILTGIVVAFLTIYSTKKPISTVLAGVLSIVSAIFGFLVLQILLNNRVVGIGFSHVASGVFSLIFGLVMYGILLVLLVLQFIVQHKQKVEINKVIDQSNQEEEVSGSEETA